MKEMIALNVRQPYAELIMRGKKKIAYRATATIKRERIYIFASVEIRVGNAAFSGGFR